MKQTLRLILSLLIFTLTQAQLFEHLRAEQPVPTNNEDTAQIFLEKHDSTFISKKISELNKIHAKIEEYLAKNTIVKQDEDRFNQKILSFAQKNEKKIDQITSNNSSEVENLQENIKTVGNKVKILMNRIEIKTHEIEELLKEKEQSIKKAKLDLSNVDSLSIKNRLETGGSGTFESVLTDSLILPGLKVDANRINFLNDNLRILAGSSTTTVKDLFQAVDTVSLLSEKCNSDLLKCKANFSQNLAKRQLLEVFA